jgi:uncharacterized membrane protein
MKKIIITGILVVGFILLTIHVPSVAFLLVPLFSISIILLPLLFILLIIWIILPIKFYRKSSIRKFVYLFYVLIFLYLFGGIAAILISMVTHAAAEVFGLGIFGIIISILSIPCLNHINRKSRKALKEIIKEEESLTK